MKQLKGLSLKELSNETKINHKRLQNINSKDSVYRLTQEEKELILQAIKLIELNIKSLETK